MVWLPPFVWKQFTATVRGSTVKIVPCENCSTEYVYEMEREGVGVGNSVYWLNDDGATERAKSAAANMLQTLLEKDFDPVPCPVCGHYQRYMFPKLLEAKELTIQAQGSWGSCLLLALILLGSLDTALTLCWSISYLLGPNDRAWRNLVVGGSVLLPLCLIGLALGLIKRAKRRSFDPNLEDQQARIAIGRNRAVTRAAFEKAQQENQDTPVRKTDEPEIGEITGHL